MGEFDHPNHRISVWNAQGQFQRVISIPPGPSNFKGWRPGPIAVDPARDRLYVMSCYALERHAVNVCYSVEYLYEFALSTGTVTGVFDLHLHGRVGGWIGPDDLQFYCETKAFIVDGSTGDICMVLTYAGRQSGRSSNVYLRLRATDFGVVMERPVMFDAATHGHHVEKYFANFRPDGDLYFYSYPSGGNPYKLSDGSFLQNATILTFKWNVNTDRTIDWYREPIAMETLVDPQGGVEELSLCGQSADGETVAGSLWRITYTRYPPPRPFDLWARFQGLHMSALGGAPLTQDPPRDPDRHYKFTVPYGSMLLVSQSTADLAGYRNPERTFYADMGGSFPFIVQINLAGDQLMGFGLAGHADDELWMVNGLTVDGTYIYVADWNYDGEESPPYTPPGDPWYTERHIHALDSAIDSFGWHHRVHDNLAQLIYQRAKVGENVWSPGVAVSPLGSARICPSITVEHDGTLTVLAEDPEDEGAVHLYRSHDHGDTWS